MRFHAASWRYLLSVILMELAVSCTAAQAGEDEQGRAQVEQVAISPCDQELKAGEVTIRFPTGLEVQAAEIAAACERVIVPAKARALADPILSLDDARLADLIADKLGQPEVRGRLMEAVSLGKRGFRDLVAKIHHEVRLFRESEVKAAGGMSAGGVTITYDPAADSFQGGFAAFVETGHDVEFFLPVYVRGDGTLRGGGGPDAALLLFDDMLPQAVFGPAVIHEAVEVALLDALSPTHVFTRWFYEGVADWVALEIITEVSPEQSEAAGEVILPTPEEDPLRAGANLPAWPLASLAAPMDAEEHQLELANYRFAAELMVRLLDGQPPDTLARLMAELKTSRPRDALAEALRSSGLRTGPHLTTDVICDALHRVTGRDARQLLSEYVPTYVKEAIAQGIPAQLLTQAQAAGEEGDFRRQAELLSQVVAIVPDDPVAHLELAIALRRQARAEALQARRARDRALILSANRHILIAAELSEDDPTLELDVTGAEDNEAWYALAVVEDLRCRWDRAKEYLAKLPPGYADADALRASLSDWPPAGLLSTSGAPSSTGPASTSRTAP